MTSAPPTTAAKHSHKYKLHAAPLAQFNMDSLQPLSKLLVFFYKSEGDLKDLSVPSTIQGLVASRVSHDGCLWELDSSSTVTQFTHDLKAELDRQGLAQSYSFSSSLTAQNSACVLSVEGMTCNSCVKLIESTIAGETGVASIKVSLQFKKAMVEYNPGVVQPAELAGNIYDMGFDAEVLTMHGPSGAQSEPPKQPPLSPEIIVKTTPLSSVVVEIEGMTCSSCVQNIQSNISQERGVANIQVSLQAKNAQISFDGSVTTPQKLADAIEDLGFEARLKCSSPLSTPLPASMSPSPSSIEDSGVGNLRKCHIGIEGMTCHSCTSLIESEVGEMEGVVSINVSLDCKEGTLEYNDAFTSPNLVGTAIEALGFQVKYITGKAKLSS